VSFSVNEALHHSGSRKYPRGQNPKLRYIKPYWWPYKTFVKERSVLPTQSLLLVDLEESRWIGRQLLEVVSTEFRDRTVEYYVRNTLPQAMPS